MSSRLTIDILRSLDIIISKMFKFTIIGILAIIFFVAYLITESIRREREGFRYVSLIKELDFGDCLS